MSRASPPKRGTLPNLKRRFPLFLNFSYDFSDFPTVLRIFPLFLNFSYCSSDIPTVLRIFLLFFGFSRRFSIFPDVFGIFTDLRRFSTSGVDFQAFLMIAQLFLKDFRRFYLRRKGFFACETERIEHQHWHRAKAKARNCVSKFPNWVRIARKNGTRRTENGKYLF